MVFFVDAVIVIASIVATALLYTLYYNLFVLGYVRRIKKQIAIGDVDKINKMKTNALKKQPKRMEKLFRKYDIEF